MEDAVYERTGAIREEREEKEKATKRADEATKRADEATKRADEAMARIKVLEAQLAAKSTC